MHDDSTIIHIRDGIATLTLNRPERHNAFDDALIATLTASLRELEADPAVHVVVLAASGKSFSAGADLNWMQRMAAYTHDENYRDALALAELMATLDGLAKPTVARVQGAAYGGGVGLVACCDIVIAAETARFCLSEVRLGLIPGAISPYVVKAMGEQQARRYFVTAEVFDAREARRIGLVHEVVAADELDARLETLLTGLAQNGPIAMAASKELARFVGRGPVDRGMIEETARRIAAVRVSDEGRDGIAAFLEKRKPGWTR